MSKKLSLIVFVTGYIVVNALRMTTGSTSSHGRRAIAFDLLLYM